MDAIHLIHIKIYQKKALTKTKLTHTRTHTQHKKVHTVYAHFLLETDAKIGHRTRNHQNQQKNLLGPNRARRLYNTRSQFALNP